jgi:endoglucanase
MNTELLKSLAAASAPSGAESPVAKLIEKEIAPFCDEVTYDKIGNLIARISPKNGTPEKKKMFVAHMDEVGFMVKNIDNDGRVRIALLGNVDTRALSGRRVMLSSGVYGIVAAKPIHVLSGGELSKPTSVKSLYIELGSKDKAETEEIVHVGDCGTFEPKFTAMKNGRFAGKALGGRSCVMLLCEMIRGIKAEELKNELYFVFSVKREIAKRQFGVETAAFTINPDSAVILDAAASADFDGVSTFERGAKCGGGVVLAPADMKTIYDRTAFADAVSYCEENQIAYQYPATAAGEGTEAGGVHRSGVGIPSLSIGIPTRNLRSGAEIVNEKDLDAAEKLLWHLI